MSHDNPFQNQFDDDFQERRSSAFYAQRTSALAILSLIFGLMSVPLMCMCFMAIPFSIAAIIMGHMSRGVVRDTNGQYSGIELGTFGMLLGYCTLFVTVLSLAFFAADTIKTPGPVRQAAAANNLLLQQAETQLFSESSETTYGASTSEHSATDLAQHYVDSLHVLDSTYFAETEADEEHPPRAYRAFVQLNDDDAAFLLFIPEYSRFTDEARKTLIESAWLIAQRTVDDVLPSGSSLAVALYSEEGRQQIMTGRTGHGDTGHLDPEKRDASAKSLTRYFRVVDSPVGKRNRSAETETTSEIDTKPLEEIPAEVE